MPKWLSGLLLSVWERLRIAMPSSQMVKRRLLRIPGLLLRTLGALEIIAVNCFLMVWTGGQLITLLNEPLIALLPILGFGSLTFLLVHYFLVDISSQRPHAQASSPPSAVIGA